MPNDSKSSPVILHGELQGAPKPVGPYSIAAENSGLVFLSGQVPIDPATGAIVPGGIEQQAQQVLANLQAVLEGLGLGFDRVLKTTIFLTDLGNFQVVNGIYGKALGDHRPARSTIQISALPLGALVEIEMTATRN